MEEIKPVSDLKCAFCGKRHEEVKRLLAGPGLFVCNECVELLYEINKNMKEDKEISEHTEINKIWLESLKVLEKELGTPTYEACLKNSYIHSFSDGICIIAVANSFAKNWLDVEEHKSLIQTTLSTISKKEVKVKFNIVSDEHKNKMQQNRYRALITYQEKDKKFSPGIYFVDRLNNTIEIINEDDKVKEIYGVKDGKITLLNTIDGYIKEQHIIYNYSFPENKI